MRYNVDGEKDDNGGSSFVTEDLVIKMKVKKGTNIFPASCCTKAGDCF